MKSTIDDARYTVAREYTGQTPQISGLRVGERWVARFCGDWIGAADSRPDARALADTHYDDRMVQAYKFEELTDVLNSDGDAFRLKVTGDNAESKWLNVTRDQLIAIRHLFVDKP